MIKAINLRIEWGAMIPYGQPDYTQPSHVTTIDCSGHLSVAGGRILGKQLYRQDVTGCGEVTETSLGELRGIAWESRIKNQVYGLRLTLEDRPDMRFRLAFPWGGISFDLVQLRKRGFLEWPFGPANSFLSVRAYWDDADPMDTGFVDDPLPEACPPEPLLTIRPHEFKGARCYARYYQRETAWIEQFREVTAGFSLAATKRLFLTFYVMAGPPYANTGSGNFRINRAMRYEILVNGHSLGVRDRWFSFFRNVQKVEEITVELLPEILQQGNNRLTLRNHDHCLHLLVVRAELRGQPMTDTPYGADATPVVLPKGYCTGFDTNTVAPENREEFTQILADIRDRQQANFALVRLEGCLIHATDLDEWVRIFKRKGINFAYLWDETSYTRRLQEQGGPLFLGQMFHEVSHLKHFYAYPQVLRPEHPTMQSAQKDYFHYIGWLVHYVKKASPKTKVIIGEDQLFAAMDYIAGADRVLAEVNMGHVGILLAEARGAKRTLRKKWLGAHFAAGCLKFPPLLDVERFYQISLYTCYLYGVNHIHDEESALTMVHGKPYSFSSRFCRGRRALLARYNRFLEQYGNPGTPEVALALVQGRYEWPMPSFALACPVSKHRVWRNFGGIGQEWSPADPEAGWKLLQVFLPGACIPDFPRRRNEELRLWHSGTPLGQCDIISSEVPARALGLYRSLIFPGWNSMDQSLYNKLIAFVKNGGNLLMAAPQLSDRVDREYVRELDHPHFILDGRVEDLFGVRLLNRTLPVSEIIFDRDSGGLIPDSRFPLPKGVANTVVKSAGAQTIASDGRGQPVLLENRLGKGLARLLLPQAFPGAAALMPVMAALCKALASEVRDDVRVDDPSAYVAWYLFRKGNQRHLWLLNTDWTTAGNVKEVRIHAGGRSRLIEVRQGEPLRIILGNKRSLAL